MVITNDYGSVTPGNTYQKYNNEWLARPGLVYVCGVKTFMLFGMAAETIEVE